MDHAAFDRQIVLSTRQGSLLVCDRLKVSLSRRGCTLATMYREGKAGVTGTLPSQTNDTASCATRNSEEVCVLVGAL
ncbi:Uncharacterized protein HZ326_21684 [Fusarium oxysporum f. sp. albedinis]|nr:Uncharacterized protein HZ326_21684 [Fusarium oxysporum f. sp. albedinis]